MKSDIIVTIYSARIRGEERKAGFGNADRHGAFAGVSMVSTRPEGNKTVADRIADGLPWCDFREIGGLGTSPHRKIVEIELPDGVSYGPFDFAKNHMYGLHAEHCAADGMGPCVYAYCNISAPVVNGDFEKAIDAAISSGILLSVPQEDGTRAEIPVKVLSVSPIYGDKAPESWTWGV